MKKNEHKETVQGNLKNEQLEQFRVDHNGKK